MIITAVAAVLGVLTLQVIPADADLSSQPAMGISIRKPTKNDEWTFGGQGFFSNSALLVTHKVDTLSIDVSVQGKAGGMGYYDPKDAANSEFKNIASFQGVVDAKKLPSKPQKLPGGGASNVIAQFLDMTFKKDDKPMELKMWVFVGKQNQNLYKVTMVCEEGVYKKHQKDADYVLGSITTFREKN